MSSRNINTANGCKGSSVVLELDDIGTQQYDNCDNYVYIMS